jgi:hypothetical protein
VTLQVEVTKAVGIDQIMNACPKTRLTQRQEQTMKLNANQVEQTLKQMDAQVLPDTHPAATQLTSVFGDHTFFLDQRGLKVLEPAEAPDAAQSGEVLSIADWSDGTLTSLIPHEPEATGTIVKFNEVRH